MTTEPRKCHDTRFCVFNSLGRCKILESTFARDGQCPFAKPDRDAMPYNFKHHEPATDKRKWFEKWPYFLKCKN